MTAHALLAGATPRPWLLDDGSVSHAVIYGNERPGVTRTVVSDIDTSWESDAAAAEAHADAQLIVAAVNEYGAHLELEQRARELLRGPRSPIAVAQLHEALHDLERMRRP